MEDIELKVKKALNLSKHCWKGDFIYNLW
jgi:hypothetical protein